MASCWRKFCCACLKPRDKDYSTLMDNGSVGNSNYKHRRKRKTNQKGTWTRKSLLMHDESEGVPLEEIAYQMKAVKIPNEYEMSSYNTESRQGQRRSARDIFADFQRNRSVSQTTIPNWMDESFAPNGRTATHLGISSVQINAKRNEIANRRSQELTTLGHRYSLDMSSNKTDKKTSSMNDLLIKRNSFNQGNITVPSINENVAITSSQSISTARTLSASSLDRGNLNYANNSKSNTILSQMNLSALGQKPLVLKESQSDVGVWRVVTNTPGYRRSNPIPRLEDYTGGKLAVEGVLEELPDVHTSRSNIEARPRPGQTTYNYIGKEIDTGINYSSNITFKKPDVSLKRDNEPALLSSSSFVNRQQKQKLVPKPRSNPTPKNKMSYAKEGESMYGYVPKLVRNVHASTALEGNQIDDFFLQRMRDRELEKFATLHGNNEVLDRENETSKTPWESEPMPKLKVRKTIPDDKMVILSDISESNNTPDEKTSSTVDPQKTYATNQSKDEIDATLKSPATAVSTTSAVQTTNVTRKVDLAPLNTEEQVIMIDFPPNLDNDKPKSPISPLTQNILQNLAINSKLLETKQNSNTECLGDINQNEVGVSLSPVKSPIDRPRITMGLAGTRAAARTDSDVSRRSTQTTSSILESAEVLY